MTGLDMVTTGAMVLLVLILMLLSLQFLKLRDVWELMINCRATMRWARIQELENRELRLELRAEKARIEQLQGAQKASEPTA
ncbi:hypothetical protein [Pseudomonas mandelii]